MSKLKQYNFLKLKASPPTGSGDELDPYFEFFFGTPRPPLMSSEKGWQPSADLFETETHVVIVVDISGISAKDIDITLIKQTLILEGVRREIYEEPARQYHTMEVTYGPFQREFQLPSPVEPDKVNAGYRDGLLTIKLLKRNKPISRRITIKIN